MKNGNGATVSKLKSGKKSCKKKMKEVYPMIGKTASISYLTNHILSNNTTVNVNIILNTSRESRDFGNRKCLIIVLLVVLNSGS